MIPTWVSLDGKSQRTPQFLVSFSECGSGVGALRSHPRAQAILEKMGSGNKLFLSISFFEKK